MNKNSKEIVKIFKQVAKSYNWIYRVGKKSITLPLEEKGGDVEKPPKWFQYWSDNVFVPFVQKQEAFNQRVEERLTKIEDRLDSLEDRMTVIEHKVDAILECPTIKKEIKL